MAGRFVDVFLRLDTRQFDAAMTTAVARTRAADREISKAARGLSMMDRSVRASGQAWRNIGSTMQSVGRGMTYIGAGMAAVGYETVKMAMNFQTSMTRLQTQAGLSAKQVDLMSKAVLNLGASGQVQFGPTQLADALYHIESVGVGTYKSLQQTSVAMNVLKVASEGAAIGGSNLEETTTALMGVLFASRAPVSQAAHYMGLINATVGAGNLRMGDLVQALGKNVIPAFRALGLTATDAFGAIALLSDSGIKASSASTQLATALHFLAQPSAKADKFLAAIGMSSTQMAADMRSPQGLLAALKDLRDHLNTLPGGAGGQDAEQVLLALFPGGRGRVMQTVIQNLDRYQNKLKAIWDTQNTLQQQAEVQKRTLSGQLHTAWAQIQSDLTKFGQTLVPIVEKWLPVFMRWFEAIFKFFNGFSPTMKTFFVWMGGFFLIGGPLLRGLGTFLKLWQGIRDAIIAIKVAGLWKTLALGSTAATAGAAGGGGVAAAGAAGAGTGAIANASRMSRALTSVARVAGPVAAVVAIGEAAQALGLTARPGAVIPQTIFGNPRFGGDIPGVANLVNKTAMGAGGSGGSSIVASSGGQPLVIHNYLNVDGRVLAKAVTKAVISKAARGPSSLVGGAISTGTVAPGGG